MVHWETDKELFSLMKQYLYTAVVGDIMDEMGLRRQFLPPASGLCGRIWYSSAGP